MKRIILLTLLFMLCSSFVYSLSITDVSIQTTNGLNSSIEDLTCSITYTGNATTVNWIVDGTRSAIYNLPFEGGSSNALLDFSGNSLNASCTNCPSWAMSGSNSNGSFTFDGVDDALTFSDSDLVNIVGPWDNRTGIIRFYAHDNTSKQLLYEEGGTTRGFNIYIDSGEVYVGGWNDDNTQSDWAGTWMSTPINANQWYEVAFVLDDGNDGFSAGKFRGYIDGVLFGSGDGRRMYAHGDDIGIGAVNGGTLYHDGSNGGSAHNFDGEIEQFSLYDIALSQQQLDNYYINKKSIDSSFTTPGNIIYCEAYAFNTTDYVGPISSENTSIVQANNNVSIQIDGQTSDFSANTTYTANITCNQNFALPSSILLNGTTLTTQTTPFTYQYNLTAGGTYNLSCSAPTSVDYSGGIASIITTINDTIAPNVNLTQPIDGFSAGSSNNISFTFGATDNTQLDSCTLYNNISGPWQTNGTYMLSGTNNQTTQTVFNVNDGTYGWNAQCCDINGLCASNPTNYTFEVIFSSIGLDSTPPVVTLNTPTGQTNTTGTVSFSVTATDNANLENCSLYTDISGTWALEETLVYTGTNFTNSFSRADVTPGTYQWNAQCCDSRANCQFNGTNQSFTFGLLVADIENLSLISETPLNYSDETLTCNYDLTGASSDAIVDWKVDSIDYFDMLTPFEGNSSNALLDASSYDQTLSCTNCPDWENGAFKFNGVDDIVTITNSNQINLGGPWDNRTIVVRFTVNDTDGRQTIFEEGGGTRGLSIYLDGSTLYVGGWNIDAAQSDWDGTYLTTSILANTEYEVALVLDDGDDAFGSNKFRGYLNGVLFGSGDGRRLYEHTGDITFGAASNTIYHDGTINPAGVFEPFNGTIEHIFLLNRSVSQEQLQAWYDQDYNTIVSQETKESQVWQCEVTGVFNEYLGNTRLSNTLTVNSAAPSSLDFTITLPGQSAINATASGNNTAEMNFTSLTTTASNLEPCVGASGVCQNSSQPFFLITNIGTLNLTIDLVLNETLPAQFALTASQTHNPNAGTNLTTTPYQLVANLTPTSTQDAFFFGRIESQLGGTTITRDLITNGTQSN